jgi:hypothetical protein
MVKAFSYDFTFAPPLQGPRVRLIRIQLSWVDEARRLGGLLQGNADIFGQRGKDDCEAGSE